MAAKVQADQAADKRPPTDERETTVNRMDDEDTCEVGTYDPRLQGHLAGLGFAGEKNDPDDGYQMFVVPWAQVSFGRARKVRAPRNLTREQKDEKLRQLRVGKTVKRLMASGKTEKVARAEAEKIYGTAGKGTKAAKPGGDPNAKLNAPRKPGQAPVAEEQPETPAPKAKAKGKKNAGLS